MILTRNLKTKYAMDWTQVIVAVLGVVTLEGLVQFFFIKVRRRHEQIKNVDSQVEVAQHANDLLSKQLDNCHETIKQLNEENNGLHAQNAALLATQSCLFDDMCIHKGCRIRKPHQGQGQLWYENYRNDPTLGADYHSIDTLIKMDRAQRAKMEKEAENEN